MKKFENVTLTDLTGEPIKVDADTDANICTACITVLSQHKESKENPFKVYEVGMKINRAKHAGEVILEDAELEMLQRAVKDNQVFASYITGQVLHTLETAVEHTIK